MIYVPLSDISDDERDVLVARLAELEMSLEVVDCSDYSFDGASPAGRSFAVFKHLTRPEAPENDVIHFHDYKGLAFYFLRAREAGLVPSAARVIIQLHGPTRWTLEANRYLFSHPDQLKIDYLEWESIRGADDLISPSVFLANYVQRRLGDVPSPLRVIKNAFRQVAGGGRPLPTVRLSGVDEIVFFGRHEERKGLVAFCDALDRLNERLSRESVQVTFLGSFGVIADQFSGTYIVDRAAKWGFPLRLLPGLSRKQSHAYLAGASGPLVVIPSREENSPYTLLEALALGLPTISSSEGGGPELLAEESHSDWLFDPSSRNLHDKILKILDAPADPPRLSQSVSEVEDEWIGFHEEIRAVPVESREGVREYGIESAPLISVVITHFERPRKMLEAVCSVLRQSYSNLEVIVVDDGSRSEHAVAALGVLENLLQRSSVQLVRTTNGYLGHARNAGLARATGEFIIFLDDDDLALPHMVDVLITAQIRTEADVVVPMNYYMPESSRAQVALVPESFEGKVSYLPLGGPLALSPVQNVFGAATALFRRSVLEAVGGYTEEFGVGHEDYELYAKLTAMGHRIHVVPEPLYLYEVERPSMLTRTSAMVNFERVVRSLLGIAKAQDLADFVSVNAGRNAHEVGHNRAYYNSSRSPEADLLIPLLTQTIDDDTRLEMLAQLAERRAEHALASDLRASILVRGSHDLSQPEGAAGSNVHSPAARRRKLGLKSAGGAEVVVPAIARAALLPRGASQGEFIEVLNELCDSVDTVSLNDARVLWSLPWSELGQPLPPHAHSVVEQLFDMLAESSENWLEDDDAAADAYSLIFFLQDLLDEAQSGAGLKEAVAIDEQRYLETNPDVADAVARGLVLSGREHYFGVGWREQRRGFALVQHYACLAAPGENWPSWARNALGLRTSSVKRATARLFGSLGRG